MMDGLVTDAVILRIFRRRRDIDGWDHPDFLIHDGWAHFIQDGLRHSIFLIQCG
jgi:hypothetical protein